MFRRILFWFGGMLLFSLVAYVGTSIWLFTRSEYPGDQGRRTFDFQFEEAIHHYETGGRAALVDYLARLDRTFRVRHHLLDRSGRDLATGADLSGLLREAREAAPRPPRFRPRPLFPGPPPPRGPFLFRRDSPDGRYVFLAQGRTVTRPDPWSNLPVYGWIVLVIVLLCYVLARALGHPIRELRQTVVRFGSGDLSSRSRLRRKDEIGDLARSFDQMADRIETLLTAERRLLQDVSHELRSPLARLRFALQLARTNPEPKAFARAEKEVDRLATLIGELLQVTRAEGDPASRNVADIELRPFLESLVEDCRIEAEARGCSIDLFAKGPIRMAGDAELLHRAVENVLRNAIHHAPEKSEVEIDAAQEDGEIVLRIRDYGPGVKEEHLADIFRPFFRSEPDRGRDNGGVGLGLAIAQRAIQLHRGQISARNANPGLLVEIRLPAEFR